MQMTTTHPDELTSMHGNDFSDCDGRRVEKLVESMREDGFDEWYPILVVGSDHRVINGRHRTIASRRVGLDEVTVVRISEGKFNELRDKHGGDYETMTDVVMYELEG